MKAQGFLFALPEPSIEGIDPAKAFASSSADLIIGGKIRKPAPASGDLWVNTGGCYSKDGRSCELYRVVPFEEFEGQTWSDSEKMTIWRKGDKYAGDFARNDPNGAYHGIRVSHLGKKMVLCGPKQKLVIDRTASQALDAAERIQWQAADEDEDLEDDDAELFDEEYDGDELEDVAGNFYESEAA